MKENIENESLEHWSFRKKDYKNNNENLVDILKSKVNEELKKSSKQKKNLNEKRKENRKLIDMYQNNQEKELKIFETTERKDNNFRDKNNVNFNFDCTLSDITPGDGIFVTDNDIVFKFPSNFLNKTNSTDKGNTYTFNIREINKLIPEDDYISKIHRYYSENKQ